MLPGLQNQDSSSMGWSGDKGIEIDTLRHMEVFTNFYKDAKYKHEKKKKNYFSFMVEEVKETTFKSRKLMEFAMFSFFFFYSLLTKQRRVGVHEYFVDARTSQGLQAASKEEFRLPNKV
jgi:hypothetical protein